MTGPSTQIGETISFRDEMTKMHGAHAFKMGFEVLHFRENSSVMNVPSGDFVFDNTTAALQSNGQPVPNMGNPFAGFEFGAVSQALFDGRSRTGCRGTRSRVPISRTTGKHSLR